MDRADHVCDAADMFAVSRLLGVAAAYVADLAFGDPRAGHPVAGFGAAARAAERITYRDSRVAGVLHVGVLVGSASLLGAALQRCADRRGWLWSVTVTAAATWVSLGGTSLARTGLAMAELLGGDDVDAARRLLPSLCGRDPMLLDADGLTRAAVESVAENTSDAHVAPLFWAVVGGAPAVLGYRAVNTLDSMVGHRSPRYVRFGWAAARSDDAANYVPARMTAALVAACAPVVAGSCADAVRACFFDAGRHPSPNAGVVEAAFAGALGVRLGGPTHYHYQLQIRPTLGAGSPPSVSDLRRAVLLSRVVQIAATLLCVGAGLGTRRLVGQAQKKPGAVQRRRP